MQIWLDSWSSDDSDQAWPVDARGVVCERHGQLLSAPRGWDLVDRRESVPRLFVPRPVLVHSRSADHKEARVVDDTAARRRQRLADLPMPQLFAELRTRDSIDNDVPMESTAHESVPAEPIPTRSDVSDRRPASNRDDGPTDGRNDGNDDHLSRLLEATSPLLSRAFGKRNTGPSDASKELMRPTNLDIVDESA